jgi:hypothetical protein
MVAVLSKVVCGMGRKWQETDEKNRPLSWKNSKHNIHQKLKVKGKCWDSTLQLPRDSFGQRVAVDLPDLFIQVLIPSTLDVIRSGKHPEMLSHARESLLKLIAENMNRKRGAHHQQDAGSAMNSSIKDGRSCLRKSPRHKSASRFFSSICGHEEVLPSAFDVSRGQHPLFDEIMSTVASHSPHP